MNDQIKKLSDIAQKKERIVLGLMSGTSLDGLDIALCRIAGSGQDTQLSLLHYTTFPYNRAIKNQLQKVCFKAEARLDEISSLNKTIATLHASMIMKMLTEWSVEPGDVDLLASHGQTVFHAPDAINGPVTLQLGDGDHLAFHTGIITLSDFRQKHIASGGEGAPLAAYGDFLLFKDKQHERFLINIGGISNLTYIPANAQFEEVVCTDIGPGNKLMDLWMQQHFDGFLQDTDALVASNGKVNYKLLHQLQSHPFFEKSFPKSTGPELFNLQYVMSCMHQCELSALRHEDVMASLNFLTANCIFNAVEGLVKHPDQTQIFVSGGGCNNPLLMQHLRNHFSNMNIELTVHLTIPSDAKEAILFALLANETIAGRPERFGKGTPSHPAISMGKISLPK